eukprot:m.159479 g.159479  ORF g.159479 m.159479 type:complete len:969 (+) comp15152_c0_seq4:42-2948(+)
MFKSSTKAFPAQLDAALAEARLVLEQAGHHEKDTSTRSCIRDAFKLAELNTKIATTAILDSFAELWPDIRSILRTEPRSPAWPRAVSLECIVKESHVLDDEKKEKEEEATQEAPSILDTLWSYFTWTEPEVEVPIFVWKCATEFEFTLNFGGKRVLLHKETVCYEETTDTSDYPGITNIQHGPFTVNLTWLVAHFDDEYEKSTFTIRGAKECKPSNHKDLKEIQRMLHNLTIFMGDINGKLCNGCKKSDMVDYNRLCADLFVPVQQRLVDMQTKGHYDTLQITNAELDSNRTTYMKGHYKYPRSFKEEEENNNFQAFLTLIFKHVIDIQRKHTQLLKKIDNLVQQEMAKIIRKHVQPKDYFQYIRKFNDTLFKKEFRPRHFSYKIKNEQSEEGNISFEWRHSKGVEEMYTICKEVNVTTFDLKYSFRNHETPVCFSGRRFIHGCFVPGESDVRIAEGVHLVSSAENNGAYVILLGYLLSDRFHAEDAILMRSKDELSIPLILEAFTSENEYKGDLCNLPQTLKSDIMTERNRRLQQVPFCVGVFHIKPQMEKVFNLPSGSLTKNAQLLKSLLDVISNHKTSADALMVGIPSSATPQQRLKLLEEKVGIASVLNNDSVSSEDDFDDSDYAELRKMDLSRFDSTFSSFRGEKVLDGIEIAKKFAKHSKKAEKNIQKLDQIASSMEGYGRRETRMHDLPLDAIKQLFTKTDNSITLMFDMDMGIHKDPRAYKAQMQRQQHVSYLRSQLDHIANQIINFSQRMRGVSAYTTKSVASTRVLKEIDLLTQMTSLKTPETQKLPFDIGNEFMGTSCWKDDTNNNNTDGFNYAKLPKDVETSFEHKHNKVSSNKFNSINTSKEWARNTQGNGLFSKRKTESLNLVTKCEEKRKANKILNALTNSGQLVFDNVDFHIILASTQCFDEMMMKTIENTENTAENTLKMSALSMASAIHCQSHQNLKRRKLFYLKPTQYA